MSDRPPLATCFGGGGAFGVGFNHGVAIGLAQRGIDLAKWPMLGTSAGSHTAAMLDVGLPFDEVADVWEEYVNSQPSRWWLDGHGLADALLGDTRGTNASAVAVTGFPPRRVVLDGREHRLADIIAASSAVAPVARTHRYEERTYLDGGVISMASIDLAAGADLLLAITPFARHEQGIAGRHGLRQANKEIGRWVERHGGDVLHVIPSREIALVGGSKIDDIGDIRIARAVHPMAVELGHHVADEIEGALASASG